MMSRFLNAVDWKLFCHRRSGMRSVCTSGTAHVLVEMMIEAAHNLHLSDPQSLDYAWRLPRLLVT
jgi:hypothetical protein